MHHHHQQHTLAPSQSASVVLDLGPDTGALLIHTGTVTITGASVTEHHWSAAIG